jgi:hypothetical protein
MVESNLTHDASIFQDASRQTNLLLSLLNEVYSLLLLKASEEGDGHDVFFSEISPSFKGTSTVQPNHINSQFLAWSVLSGDLHHGLPILTFIFLALLSQSHVFYFDASINLSFIVGGSAIR